MKLYVGNLNFNFTDKQLEDLFSNVDGQQFQVQSAKVITDRETGRSKGFAFVEMPDNQAQIAMQALNKKVIMDRELTVNEARPREEGGRGNGGGNRGGFRGGYDRGGNDRGGSRGNY